MRHPMSQHWAHGSQCVPHAASSAPVYRQFSYVVELPVCKGNQEGIYGCIPWCRLAAAPRGGGAATHGGLVLWLTSMQCVSGSSECLVAIGQCRSLFRALAWLMSHAQPSRTMQCCMRHLQPRSRSCQVLQVPGNVHFIVLKTSSLGCPAVVAQLDSPAITYSNIGYNGPAAAGFPASTVNYCECLAHAGIGPGPRVSRQWAACPTCPCPCHGTNDINTLYTSGHASCIGARLLAAWR